MAFVKHVILGGVLLLFFSFCRPENPAKDMNQYFQEEINNRKLVLDTLKIVNDSLRVNTAAVDEEIDNLILMSLDVENISAAVNKGNGYFLNLANTYGINYSDFTKLSTAMSPQEIATNLKQNELNFFNQVILKSSPAQTTPFTAQ